MLSASSERATVGRNTPTLRATSLPDIFRDHMTLIRTIPGQFSEITSTPSGLEWRCRYQLPLDKTLESGQVTQLVFSLSEQMNKGLPEASLCMYGVNTDESLTAVSLKDMDAVHEQIISMLGKQAATVGLLQHADRYTTALSYFKAC